MFDILSFFTKDTTTYSDSNIVMYVFDEDTTNERNESWLSYCRVQLIFCKTIQNNFFQKQIRVTTCNIVGTLYW